MLTTGYNSYMEKSYKQLETELHDVLNRIENDSYEELDALLEEYNTGMKLIATLQKKLESAQNSIKKVKTSSEG